MPDTPLPPKETPGQHCARWLKAAKTECQQNNTVLTWERVAKIIDGVLDGIAYYQPVEAKKNDLGDRRVIPPEPEWVTAYSASIGYPLDGEAWCDTYQQKGWMVGKTKMKDWQSALRNWKRSGYTIGKAIREANQQRDYTKLA